MSCPNASNEKKSITLEKTNKRYLLRVGVKECLHLRFDCHPSAHFGSYLSKKKKPLCCAKVSRGERSSIAINQAEILKHT